MYKYKKLILYVVTISYIILSLIEFIKYFYIDTTLYGLIYLIMNLIIIFLMIPVTYNYKRQYSKARVSKIIIVIILGIVNSYLLNKVFMGVVSYMDSSKYYIDSILIIKSYLKGILYFLLIIFLAMETKIYNVLINISRKVDKH